MSIQDAEKFLDHVDDDPKAQQQLKEAFGKLVEIGKDHGYEFTQAELNEHLHKRWGLTKAPSYDDPDTCTFCI